MSIQLLGLAKQFLKGNLRPEEFVDSFHDGWRTERDNGTGSQDPDNLSECLSTLFCLADLYNSDNARESYELDAPTLKSKIQLTICKHKLE